MKRRERQNDIAHYQFNRHPIEQAAHQRVLRHKPQAAARPIVNSRSGASDEEVQENAQNIRCSASMYSLTPQQAGRNHEWNLPSKQNASL
jgi:hypothetical protein